MSQREKDLAYYWAQNPHETPRASKPRAMAEQFHAGAEYGRKDLAKLERLLRAGWSVDCNPWGGECVVRFRATRYRGATLAEALAQVPDP